ncbi:23S rRNA (adenine(1618)-N(6))-methyltransferase RlmF [Vibrio gallaecicus]|uniref:Ribosomal RNA large subunit methyltransferase F n=1 Tax=Vibrio gallaecicus TaxID=552386 RepID=A0ABV4ND04_9VIBR
MSQSENKKTLSLPKRKPASHSNADKTPKVTSKSKPVKKGSTSNKNEDSSSKFKSTSKPNAKKTANKPANAGSYKQNKNKSGFKGKNGQKGFKDSKKQSKPSGLHPRNQHTGRYDFSLLVKALPELAEHLIKNPSGEDTVNFSDPVAVKLLNKALLAHHYGVKHWDIPVGYLCPPIPGRADYIHRVADLLNSECEDGLYPHKSVKAFDVGVGANCIYPIIGATEYNWKFTGSDVDPLSIKAANFIAESNPTLKGKIRCKLQHSEDFIFKGIIAHNERYDVTICNPPFHSSLEEAEKGSQRKIDNLAANRAKKSGQATANFDRSKLDSNKLGKNKFGKNAAPMTNKEQPISGKPVLNFGGQKSELWCEGGEAEFVSKMARESRKFSTQVLWFTTLLSKKDNVEILRKELDRQQVKQVKVVEMSQGQKVSRFVAWTFMDKQQRQEWIKLK